MVKLMVKKSVGLLLLAIAIFALLDRFVHRDIHRFTLSKVISFMPGSPSWNVPALPPEEKEEVKKILAQDFTYFDKGSQAYVFLSADGKYVLKLFKQHKLRPMTWTASLTHFLPEQNYKYKYKKNKFREALVSCKNAFVGFREDTGLLYLHLNKGPDLGLTAACINERGEKIRVNLDDTVFMLQKRADLVYPTVANLMERGDIDAAKTVITSVVDLLRRLDAEGVYGNDPVIKKNFGIVEGKAIQIDVGRFRVNPHKPFREDIPRITAHFKAWVDEQYPELSAHFAAELSSFASG